MEDELENERRASSYADAVANYASLRKELTGDRSTGTTHLSFIHLKTSDHHDVAVRILKINRHGKAAASAVFGMGDSVQAFLHINSGW